jgi:excisionase family DNA binding protein
VELDPALIDRVERVQAGYVAWRVSALGGTAEWLPHGAVVARCVDHAEHWYAKRIVAVSPRSIAAVVVAAANLSEDGLPVRVEVPEPLRDERLRRTLRKARLAPAWSPRALAAPMLVPPAAVPAGVGLERVETISAAERFWAASVRLAAYLGVSVRTAYNLAHNGEVPVVRVGGQHRIPRDELDRTLTRNRDERLAATPDARKKRVTPRHEKS